jgi:hypothetical protein
MTGESDEEEGEVNMADVGKMYEVQVKWDMTRKSVIVGLTCGDNDFDYVDTVYFGDRYDRTESGISTVSMLPDECRERVERAIGFAAARAVRLNDRVSAMNMAIETFFGIKKATKKKGKLTW